MGFSGNPGVPWPAVDGLGRALPTAQEVGAPKAGRFVGIFYFLWLGQHDQPGEGPFDVAKIMSGHPDALRNPNSPPWGPAGHMHFWGEPLYGYYLVSDPWVLRRHAHLLADARTWGGLAAALFYFWRRRWSFVLVGAIAVGMAVYLPLRLLLNW